MVQSRPAETKKSAVQVFIPQALDDFAVIPFNGNNSTSWTDALKILQIKIFIGQLMTRDRPICYTFDDNGRLIRLDQPLDKQNQQHEKTSEKPSKFAINPDSAIPFVIPCITKGKKPQFIIVENSHLFGLFDPGHFDELRTEIIPLLPKDDNGHLKHTGLTIEETTKIAMKIMDYIQAHVHEFAVHAAGTIKRISYTSIHCIDDASGGFHIEKNVTLEEKKQLDNAFKNVLRAALPEPIITNAVINFIKPSLPSSTPARTRNIDETVKAAELQSIDDTVVYQLQHFPRIFSPPKSHPRKFPAFSFQKEPPKLKF